MAKHPQKTDPPKERAFLVGVDIRTEHSLLEVEDSLEELAMLADTAGMNVVGQTYQRRDTPNPSILIGKGKLQEVKDLAEDLMADAIIFDNELSPRHQRELEKEIGKKIKLLDRTALILDIFAMRASTREGALQVELAQYEYRLPRLTRMWTHLVRQSGGGGSSSAGSVGVRGPGETQLESDRREINARIVQLRRDLEKVRAHRGRHRQRRQRSATPVVALAGYTNAGKSTLLNALTNAEIYIADQLFATLDPTTRRVEFPDGQAVLLTDTVGFIQKLPTALVAAFRATLEEIVEADLILHVADLTHDNVVEHIDAVQQTLDELGSEAPSLMVFNKIDLMEDQSLLDDYISEFPEAVFISAYEKQGLDSLFQTIQARLNMSLEKIDVFLPYSAGQLISLIHERGQVDQIEHLEDGVHVIGRVPQRLVARFLEGAVKRNDES